MEKNSKSCLGFGLFLGGAFIVFSVSSEAPGPSLPLLVLVSREVEDFGLLWKVCSLLG